MNVLLCGLSYGINLIFFCFILGPPLVTTKDAGDAVTLLQSLAGSTFDSSQLVLTACMGYKNVNEVRLQELRHKHRPSIRATVEERSKGLQAWRDSQGLASKLYGFKHDPASLMIETSKSDQLAGTHPNGDISHTGLGSGNLDGFIMSLNGDVEIDSVPDLQQQVSRFNILFPKFNVLFAPAKN